MFAMLLVVGFSNAAHALHRRGMTLLGERHIDGQMDTDKRCDRS
ncbi:MAG: hypothetical protein ABI446_11720 [Gemmatimonadaceae bacterium]